MLVFFANSNLQLGIGVLHHPHLSLSLSLSFSLSLSLSFSLVLSLSLSFCGPAAAMAANTFSLSEFLEACLRMSEMVTSPDKRMDAASRGKEAVRCQALHVHLLVPLSRPWLACVRSFLIVRAARDAARRHSRPSCDSCRPSRRPRRP